jgi:hypothetical protein
MLIDAPGYETKEEIENNKKTKPQTTSDLIESLQRTFK